MHIDQAALDAALAGLPRSGVGPADFGRALNAVVEAAASVLGASGSGIMFVDGQHSLRYVAATDDDVRVLEVVQEEVGEGPCVDTLVEDVVVATVDVTDDSRWAQLAPLLAPTRVRAVLGVPVHVAGAAVGSLNVYRDEAGEWDDESVDALGALNVALEGIISAAVLARRNDDLVAQLQDALDGRVVIERAVGLVMGRDGLDAVGAFNQLRSRARRERRKVLELAGALLEEARQGPPCAEGFPEGEGGGR